MGIIPELAIIVSEEERKRAEEEDEEDSTLTWEQRRWLKEISEGEND
jgi:hypothetical protein